MYKYAIARQLATKKLITNRGDNIGRLVDLMVNEVSGEIEALLVEIDPSSKVVKQLDVQGNLLEIPYRSVIAVSDVFVIDEKILLTKDDGTFN
ncbi:MAG TPA: PRC-barrel domain-containing protein [archaeon]|jgi:sporulation protein YlmC with PRC-barrel domain|nr:PRC-barrel domain-containing protein [archaeon]HPV66044.1 PRC-barrel domain-containing protein [archaeon]HRS42318.1 PRC-barrel domain-containing protein [Candidatus Diapherotrites archaeon]